MTKRKLDEKKAFWTALAVAGVWLGWAALAAPASARFTQIASNDPSAFLPAGSESALAQATATQYLHDRPIPAVIVLESRSNIVTDKYKALDEFAPLADQLHGVPGVERDAEGLLGPFPSIDKKGLEYLAFIPDKTTDNLKRVVAGLRQVLTRHLPAGVSGHVSGPAGFAADHSTAYAGINGPLLLVALALVFLILLLTYRSLLMPLIVLSTAMFGLSAAKLAIYWLAINGFITLTGQSGGILSILVIGAATDYSLLYLSRYREALTSGAGKWAAILAAWRSAWAPIAASAGTVILAFLCLLLSNLNSNRSLGPVSALGIAFAMLAVITLLPALLGLFGRAAFWPVIPHRQHAGKAAGWWGRLGDVIAASPRRIWLGAILLLVICMTGLPQFNASGASQSATLLGPSDAKAGLTALSHHFPAGAGSPVIIIATKSREAAVINAVVTDPNVAEADPQPVVFGGRTLIDATLQPAADSDQAQRTVARLRTALHQLDPGSLVGGDSAVALDTAATSWSDLWRVIPIALSVILIVLILLLRSLIAPLIMIISVIVSYAATLGTSAYVFNHWFHFSGADPSIPMFGFIFLVALGVDYNIFLMTRVREESIHHGTRQGVIRGLERTGGVITSAGIILAATFGALSVIPILYLVQIAWIVAFGVILDTFIVRSLLVPALAYDFGKRIWWPGRML